MLAAGLTAEFDLSGVPGFFRLEKEWKLNLYGGGFLIPVRDRYRRIQGLQVRTDRGRPKYFWLSSADKPRGASSGAPAHFAKPLRTGITGEVVITEGALKAEIIAEHTPHAVVGLPGVGAFTLDFGERLKKALPFLQHAVIAFDMDWQVKPGVRRQLERLTETLEAAKLAVTIQTWPPELGKGYDNYLLGLNGANHTIGI